VDDACAMLQSIFQTDNTVVIHSASGRAGIEATFTSALESGDTILIPSNGVFGNMLAAIARAIDLNCIQVSFEAGAPFDLGRIEEAVSREKPRAIAAVHCATSTGMLTPAAETGEIARHNGIFYFLDCISSLGGAEIKTDEWGVDVAMSASQKALSALPGLSILAVSERMWQAFRNRRTRIRGYYLDLNRWRTMWLPPERGGELVFSYRRPPHTMATHLILALHEACRMVMEEGLQTRFRRHQRIAEAFRAAVRAAGCAVVPAAGTEAPTVTGFTPPAGIQEKPIRTRMKELYGISIADGLEELYGTMLRIGHMGTTASERYVVPALLALELSLSELGAPTSPGSTTAAFRTALDQYDRRTGGASVADTRV